MSKTDSRPTLLAGLLVGSLLLACAGAGAPAADPDRAALEAAIHRWTAAVNARDVATLTATMTDDVELRDNLATARGRDAALTTLRELAAGGRLIATSREISVANDIAWHTVSLTQAQRNGDMRARGQALEIWKRVNGDWKLHRRMAADIGPGITVTRPPVDEPVLDRPRD